MKHKIHKPEPATLSLESPAPDDPKLPRPRGKLPPERKTNIHEAARLKRTRNFGGLVPESKGEQYWACGACGNVHMSKADAFGCHGRGANRIQVCSKCRRRLADCNCNRRF